MLRRNTRLAAVGILSCVLAATALAATGNTIKIATPSHARVDKQSSVGFSGYADTREYLEIYIQQPGACRASPALEHKYFSGSAAYQDWTVSGGYHHVAHFFASEAGTAHACAYLEEYAANENESSKGVFANRFASFKVS